MRACGCSPLTALGTHALCEQCTTAAKGAWSICCLAGSNVDSQGFSCSGVGSCRRRDKQNWADLKISHTADLWRDREGLSLYAARWERHGAPLPPKERGRCPRVAQPFLIGRCADWRQKQPVRGSGSWRSAGYGTLWRRHLISRRLCGEPRGCEGGRQAGKQLGPPCGRVELRVGALKGGALLGVAGPARELRGAEAFERVWRVSSPNGAGGGLGAPQQAALRDLPCHCGTKCWWTESTGVWENSRGLQGGISCCGVKYLLSRISIFTSILTGFHIALSLCLLSADSALGP